MAAFVSSLPTEKKLEFFEVLVEHSRVETTFSGPLPAPGDFKKYSDVLPNAADRILSMAEKEQEIRLMDKPGCLPMTAKKSLEPFE